MATAISMTTPPNRRLDCRAIFIRRQGIRNGIVGEETAAVPSRATGAPDLSLGCLPALVLAIAILLAARSGSTCVIPPSEFFTPHAELVQRTERIALGRFTKHTVGIYSTLWNLVETLRRPDIPMAYIAHFKTVQVLKGDVGNSFSVRFDGEHPEGFTDHDGIDFDQHRDWAFWQKGDRLTRQWNDSDCKMRPRFEVGATYLIFLDRPFHIQGFERIEHKEDRWLRAVRALIDNPNKNSGLRLDTQQFLAEQQAIYIGQTDECRSGGPQANTHRHRVRVVEKLFGDPPDCLMTPSRWWSIAIDPHECQCQSGYEYVVFLNAHGIERPVGDLHQPPMQLAVFRDPVTNKPIEGRRPDAVIDLAPYLGEIEFTGKRYWTLRDLQAFARKSAVPEVSTEKAVGSTCPSWLPPIQPSSKKR